MGDLKEFTDLSESELTMSKYKRVLRHHPPVKYFPDMKMQKSQKDKKAIKSSFRKSKRQLNKPIHTVRRANCILGALSEPLDILDSQLMQACPRNTSEVRGSLKEAIISTNKRVCDTQSQALDYPTSINCGHDMQPYPLYLRRIYEPISPDLGHTDYETVPSKINCVQNLHLDAPYHRNVNEIPIDLRHDNETFPTAINCFNDLDMLSDPPDLACDHGTIPITVYCIEDDLDVEADQPKAVQHDNETSSTTTSDQNILSDPPYLIHIKETPPHFRVDNETPPHLERVHETLSHLRRGTVPPTISCVHDIQSETPGHRHKDGTRNGNLQSHSSVNQPGKNVSQGKLCHHFPRVYDASSQDHKKESVTKTIVGQENNHKYPKDNFCIEIETPAVNEDRSDKLRVNEDGSHKLRVKEDRSHKLRVNEDRSHKLRVNENRSHKLRVNEDRSHKLRVNEDRSHKLRVNEDRSHKLRVNEDRSHKLRVNEDGSHKLRVNEDRSHKLRVNEDGSHKLRVNEDRSQNLRAEVLEDHQSMTETTTTKISVEEMSVEEMSVEEMSVDDHSTLDEELENTDVIYVGTTFQSINQVSSCSMERCLSCGDQLEDFCRNYQHPLFEGNICSHCKNYLTSSLYAVDRDGHCPYCAVCGDGGNLFVCEKESCHRSFCRSCLERLGGQKLVHQIKHTNPWYCFLCSTYSKTSHGGLNPRKDWQIQLIKFFQTDRTLLCTDLDYLTSNNKRKIRVLSLFDGTGTGKLVLNELKFDIDVYYASEIDPEAKLVASYHHCVTHVGDAIQLDRAKLEEMCPIDLVIGGPPCNDLSVVNPLRKGFRGSGMLLLKFVTIVKDIEALSKGRNHVFWLLENTSAMQTDYKTVISTLLGMEPAVWDAKYFTGQKRRRFFWGNIPGLYRMPSVIVEELLPFDFLKHGLQSRPPSPKRAERKVRLRPFREAGSGQNNGTRTPEICKELEQQRKDLSPALIANCNRKALIRCMRTITTKQNSLTVRDGSEELPIMMDGVQDGIWVTEIERLFGFPEHYTDVGQLNLNTRRRLLGKSWVVDVIKHLLAPLKQYFVLREP